MNKNLVSILAFLLVLIGMFWVMSDEKVEVIGDFFEKLIIPIGTPLSIVIGVGLGIMKLREFTSQDDK